MTNYRRNRVPGGTYFFTVNLYDRRTALLVQHIEHLRDAVRKVRLSEPFHIDAFVVLPDHLHCVWTLPADDTNYSGRWRAIKTIFSKHIPPDEFRSASRHGKGERGIWQRRFWEHTIRDAQDYTRHIDYVHFNPVKHGLVAEPKDWPFSSFHRTMAAGLYPSEWAGVETPVDHTGER
ncbi:MAG: transposase [Acidocella sp.]|nr:transposase [Acidocella sp.]